MHSGTYLLHSPVIIYWHRNWTPPIFFKIQSYWKRVVDTSPNHAPSHAKEYCISHRWSLHKCQFILSKVRPFDSKLVVCRARRNIQLRRNLNPAKLNSLNVLVLVLYSHTPMSSACHNHTISFVRFFCGCGWQKKSSILGWYAQNEFFPDVTLNIFYFLNWLWATFSCWNAISLFRQCVWYNNKSSAAEESSSSMVARQGPEEKKK